MASNPLPHGHATSDVFLLKLRSELVFDGDAGVTQPSWATTRTGIEWGNTYRISGSLHADFNAAFSRARFDQNVQPDDLGCGDAAPSHPCTEPTVIEARPLSCRRATSWPVGTRQVIHAEEAAGSSLANHFDVIRTDRSQLPSKPGAPKSLVPGYGRRASVLDPCPASGQYGTRRRARVCWTRLSREERVPPLPIYAPWRRQSMLLASKALALQSVRERRCCHEPFQMLRELWGPRATRPG